LKRSTRPLSTARLTARGISDFAVLTVHFNDQTGNLKDEIALYLASHRTVSTGDFE